MQTVIAHIFEKLGGPTAIANGVGLPVQTVHSWLGADGKKPKAAEIPPWRRAAVLDLARRDKKLDDLTEEARAYLASPDRMVGKAAA